MPEDATARPTLDTILERINALSGTLEDRLEQIETRLDRTQGIALELRADFREFRVDFREFRNQFKQPA